jgi:RNAse (barnase) inhibitor barstar
VHVFCCELLLLFYFCLALDFLDGFFARRLNVISEFGKQLDSLADLISFGALPSTVLFFHIAELSDTDLKYFSFLILIFSVIRLAKFNLADENNTEVVNVDVLNKNTPLVAQAGFEPKIIGTAFSLDLNESSKLIEGETGVYMIRVDKITKAENLPNSFTPYEKQVSSKLRSNIDFNVVQSLKKSSEIVDNRSDYY